MENGKLKFGLRKMMTSEEKPSSKRKRTYSVSRVDETLPLYESAIGSQKGKKWYV